MLNNNYEYVMKQVDYAIKMAWLEDVSNDYRESYLIKEDSLKNALYFHVRKRLDNLFQMYNLRMYTEYNETNLKANNMRADIAIVEIEPDSGKYYLGDRVRKVLAIIELKYGSSVGYMAQDIEKLKRYRAIKELDGCQYYLGILNEATYDKRSFWLNGHQTNNWAKGYVTELDACRYAEYKEGSTAFSVYSYNTFNPQLNTEHIEQMKFVKLS